MNPVLATIGMLLGILMVVCGVLTCLVTGLDLLYSAIGIGVAIGGGAAAWYCQRQAPAQSESSSSTHERSVQKPIEPETRSKFSKKI